MAYLTHHRAGNFPSRMLIWALAALPLGQTSPPSASISLPPPSAPARPWVSIPSSEPTKNHPLETDSVRALNAAVPFSTRANPAASPFHFHGAADDLARATDCLASAQIYEAGDDAVGERAVAQVVLNRVRHPAFPKSICGVVFQGQERRIGCQFTFTCDGALARRPSPTAWERARAIAKAALDGAVFSPVGLSTHYHTDWVMPPWSVQLEKTTQVGTHLFFRWTGRSGTAPAFNGVASAFEPVIHRISSLSAAHRNKDPSYIAPTDPRDASTSAPAALAAVQLVSPANKNWTPAPTVPLPVGARHVEAGIINGPASRTVEQP